MGAKRLGNVLYRCVVPLRQQVRSQSYWFIDSASKPFDLVWTFVKMLPGRLLWVVFRTSPSGRKLPGPALTSKHSCRKKSKFSEQNLSKDVSWIKYHSGLCLVIIIKLFREKQFCPSISQIHHLDGTWSYRMFYYPSYFISGFLHNLLQHAGNFTIK